MCIFIDKNTVLLYLSEKMSLTLVLKNSDQAKLELG